MYETLLLIDIDANLTVEKLKLELEAFYKDKTGAPESIVLIEPEIRLVWPGFTLKIYYSDEPHVIEESHEIAVQFAKEHEAHDRIQLSKSRFEITGDDDPAMDYFNDYVFVIEAAQRIGMVYPFNPNSGEFI